MGGAHSFNFWRGGETKGGAHEGGEGSGVL